MGWPIDMEQMGCESIDCGPMLWLSTFTSPMTFTLDFQGQILKKNHISGKGWPIDMERKGCESIGCYTHFVTFTFDLNHDLDLDFHGQILKKSYLRNGMGQLTWNERDVSW